MRTPGSLLAATLVTLLAGPADAGEVVPPRRVNFTQKPAVKNLGGGKCEIAFAVSRAIDVEVCVVDAAGSPVRHLAAGVLGGRQPPPSPLKPGLSQKIVWDGKADWKVEAKGGPFKVRVRAGMGVKLGGFVGDSPHNLYETHCRGMAVDPASGDLYFLGRRGRGSAILFLRVYDRSGKYLREIMPYPGSLDARSRRIYGAVSVPGTDAPVPLNRMSIWPTFYPMVSRAAPHKDLPVDVNVRLVGLHPAEKDTLVLADGWFHSLYRVRSSDGGVPEGRPFEEPLWPAGTKLAHWRANARTMGAFSAEGKHLYLAGYSGFAPKDKKLHPAWPEGRIYMKNGTGTLKTFADVALPGDAPGARQGSPAKNQQNLHGMAVDSKGNLLVCDAAAAKVRILSPEGEEIGTIATPPYPYVLALNEKAGVIYVVTRRKTGVWMRPASLVRISGWRPGGEQSAAKVTATLNFPASAPRGEPFVAADITGKVPQIWVSGAPRGGSLLRIEDRGAKLEVVEDLADRGKTAAGFAVRMDVDVEKDLVYVHNGWGQIRRYDGVSGEYAGKLGKDGRPVPIIGSEFCVRRDGTVYVSGHDGQGGWAGPWKKFKRDLTPDGQGAFGARYGKMGGGYFGNSGSCVTPDGRLLYNGMYTWRSNAIFEIAPDGKPGRMPRMRDFFANGKIHPSYKAADIKGTLIGPLQDQSGGVEVDQEGNIYCGVNVQPLNYELPGDLAKHKIFWGTIGSVVKFKPTGGALWPDGAKPGSTHRPSAAPPLKVPVKLEAGIRMGRGQSAYRCSNMAKTFLEGAVMAYPDLAPFSGFERGQGHCACQTPRFEVDYYGRLIVPNALTCSVKIVDNAGNVILRFGRYGNHDDGRSMRNGDAQSSRTPHPASRIHLAYPCAAKSSFRHIYVADSANRRVVRVDPVYAVEETCAVR
ncbi:MAG: NHL repeat-containing protein [Planctomycetota bacterium]|jgi:hypothetical protein